MENFTELQKPNVEAEVYNNNKKCDWGEKKLKSLVRFHNANKINNYIGRGGEKQPKRIYRTSKNIRIINVFSWVTTCQNPFPHSPP